MGKNKTQRRRKKRRHEITKKATTKLLGSKEKALENFQIKDIEEGKVIPLVGFEEIEIEIEPKKGKKQLVSNEQQKLQFIKAFETPYNSKIRPNQNYYEYITDSWSKVFTSSEQQQVNSKYDNFTLVQYNVYYQLFDIFDKFTKNNHSAFAKNMSNFQKSVSKFNSIKKSLQFAKEITEYIDTLRKEPQNIWKYVAMLNRYLFISQFSFFYFRLAADDMDPDKFRVHLYPEKFSAMDNVLFNGDESNPKIKRMLKAKLKFYDEVFTCIYGKNHGFSVRDTYDAFKEEYMILKETAGSNGYYKIYKDEALEKYGFDWVQFATLLGFKKVPDFFITSNIEYLSKLMKLLLEKWTTDKWRPLILMKVYRFIIRFTEKWRNVYSDYYGRFLKGLGGSVYIDNKNVTIIYLVYPYANFLSKEYYKRYYNEQVVMFVRKLANDLKAAFLKILHQNSWMSSKTKAAAIDKIEKLQFFIAEPEVKYAEEIYSDCTNVTMDANDLLTNLINISNDKLKKMIQLEGKKYVDLQSIDWTEFPFKILGNKAFTVNAYYAFRNNSITVNLALLQPPFVDLKNVGLQYNLATIGFVIAHEMSHALDSIGGKYNANGKLENWWAPQDMVKYKKIQEDVLNQYETFAARDGVEFNAQLSLSEDLADISGLAICEEYLRDYMMTMNAITPVKYLNFRIFHTYFAYMLRQYIPKSAIEPQLLTNPHPPDVYRVNVPLSRSLTFRAAYDVKKKDKMWWSNTNTIW